MRILRECPTKQNERNLFLFLLPYHYSFIYFLCASWIFYCWMFPFLVSPSPSTKAEEKKKTTIKEIYKKHIETLVLMS